MAECSADPSGAPKRTLKTLLFRLRETYCKQRRVYPPNLSETMASDACTLYPMVGCRSYCSISSGTRIIQTLQAGLQSPLPLRQLRIYTFREGHLTLPGLGAACP